MVFLDPLALRRLTSEPFTGYLFKFSSVIFKKNFPASIALPTFYDHVDVPWIKLNKPRSSARGLARD